MWSMNKHFGLGNQYKAPLLHHHGYSRATAGGINILEKIVKSKANSPKERSHSTTNPTTIRSSGPSAGTNRLHGGSKRGNGKELIGPGANGTAGVKKINGHGRHRSAS